MSIQDNLKAYEYLMTTHTLTISTAALGLGILSSVRVTVNRKRTVVSDVFPSVNLTFLETFTNGAGIADILLYPDDSTVFHEVRIYNSRNIVIYVKAFTMPPQSISLDLLPLQDIINASASQAVEAAASALVSQTNAANSEQSAATSAESAEADAATAYTKASEALMSATTATSAKIAAELARDSTLLNNNIYASTAVGLADTVNGDYFAVVAADSSEYLILYLNDSGTPIEQKRYPSTEKVSRIASGDFSELGFSFRNLSPESGYAFALQDKNGRSVLLAKFDGTVEIPKYDKQQYIPQELLSDTGYSWGILDANKRMALGVDLEGSLVFSGSKYIKPSRNLWCLGDSLTAGAGGQITWREALPSLLTKSRIITNWAIGGQTSTQIAARAGSYNTLLTLTGNQIPSSGAVSITARTVSLLTSQGTQSITGSLNGVAGTLARDGSDNYTFTRTTSGTATYTAPNSPFIPDIQQHDFDTFIIFLGRNNLSLPNDIIRDIDACVALQKTIEKRFLIITPPNGGTLSTGQSTSEGTGSSTLTNIKQVEDYVVQKYGDKVLKVREFSYQFNNGSADDLDDVAKETVPRSLRIDGVHWTTTFHAHVAQWVANQLNTRGW